MKLTEISMTFLYKKLKFKIKRNKLIMNISKMTNILK